MFITGQLPSRGMLHGSAPAPQRGPETQEPHGETR